MKAVEEHGQKAECKRKASDVKAIPTAVMDANSAHPGELGVTPGTVSTTSRKKSNFSRIMRSIFVDSGALKCYAINFLLGYNLRYTLSVIVISPWPCSTFTFVHLSGPVCQSF